MKFKLIYCSRQDFAAFSLAFTKNLFMSNRGVSPRQILQLWKGSQEGVISLRRGWFEVWANDRTPPAGFSTQIELTCNPLH